MRRLHSVLGGVGFLGGESRVAPSVAAADDGGGRTEQDASAAATARRQPGGRAHQRHGTTVTTPIQSICLLGAKFCNFNYSFTMNFLRQLCFGCICHVTAE